jgi:hypothetical protein
VEFFLGVLSLGHDQRYGNRPDEPEDFSEDDAKNLQIFAEMFLAYAFTLPAMPKRARAS